MGRSRTTVFSHAMAASIGTKRFAQLQTEAHRARYLLVGQSHVAVTLFASDLPAEPGRWLESSAGYAVGELHFRNYQASMSATININLHQQISPWDFVT